MEHSSSSSSSSSCSHACSVALLLALLVCCSLACSVAAVQVAPDGRRKPRFSPPPPMSRVPIGPSSAAPGDAKRKTLQQASIANPPYA
uniref:Uncharacterized protein n=1 Tax=Triticum aestivum TaxID=4565 RepID=A0A0B4SUR9_WHEAT|nr:hypothetical protein [Triticum aestivum]